VHPNLLKVHAAEDTNKETRTEGSYVIVTESALPLRVYMSRNKLTDEDLILGIMGVCQAVKFTNANGIALNVPGLEGVWVTDGGEFKVFGYYGTQGSPFGRDFYDRNPVSSGEMGTRSERANERR